jgi:hypothetical protein
MPVELQPMPLTQTKAFRIGAALLILLFLAIYSATLDTGLQPYELHGGDLITHQYAQVQARPGNAPGYPLYTLGGWVWFHSLRALLQTFLPTPPNPMPILSSYSTLWGLLALGLFYALIGRLIDHPRRPVLAALVALLATAYLGLTYFFWYYATTTEQYSSAVAQTLAIVYVYLLWEAQPQRRDLVLLLAFLCGLTLAHMLTVAFIVPPLVAVMIWRAPKFLLRPRMIAGAILAAALPLISYLYVYWRGALHPEWWGRGEWASPQAWFWSFVSTSQGREELLWAFEPGRGLFGNGFPELIWQELSIPLLILGLIGIGWMTPPRRVLLYGTLIIYLAFCWLYRFGNWFQVILPAYPLVLLGLAPIYRHTEAWSARLASSSRSGQRRAAKLTLALLPVLLALLVVWRGATSLPRADSRHRPEDTALARAGTLIAQELPVGSALFAAVDDALALDYLTRIWAIRPDLHIVSSREADALLAAGTAVYSTADATPTLLNELARDTRLNSVGADWIELAPALRGQALVTPTLPAVESITPELSLVAIQTALAAPDPLTGRAPDGLDVLLSWELPTGVWPAGHAISLRPLHNGTPLLGPTGAPIQQDRTAPVHGLWRPPATAPQTWVNDGYHLPLPPAALTQVDGLLIIVYTQAADGSFVNVAEIRHSLP